MGRRARRRYSGNTSEVHMGVIRTTVKNLGRIFRPRPRPPRPDGTPGGR